MAAEFSILICTKDRKQDLLFTLQKIQPLLGENACCTVIDDGSSDGSFEAVRAQFPNVSISRNTVSKGYLFCRNKMLNETRSEFAISLDDDAHFVSGDPLAEIRAHFGRYPRCGVVAFRIFWGLQLPADVSSGEPAIPVKGFVGCGHAWRMSAWRSIPDYPEWFRFYGEESFASRELFKRGLSVDYVPSVLVQHRVDGAKRRKAADRARRERFSLASGWFLFFLHFPLAEIPKELAYSIYLQLRDKVLKGDLSTLRTLFLAHRDVLWRIPHIARERGPFTSSQYRAYKILPPAKNSWKP